MANYVLVDSDQLNADLTSIADTIRAKGGTSAQLAFPSEFKSAVNAISTGVTVQRTSGTFTTDSNGNATVNCGFKPDLVAVLVTETNEDGDYYHLVFGFTALDRETAVQCSEAAEYLLYMGATRTATGFTIDFANKYSFDWEYIGSQAQAFQYVAVKYI